MENVSVRLEPETIEQVEQEAEEQGMKRAVYLREIIETRHESEEIQNEYERIQAERDRLQRKLQSLIAQQEEHGDLVEYVEREKSLQERRERRETERRQANVVRRARWWLFGEPEREPESDVDAADRDEDE